MGTKQIPISRPQIICWGAGKETKLAIFFRDQERGNKVSVVTAKIFDRKKWEVYDLFDGDVGSWEPTYDIDLWTKQKLLHLFIQRVAQADAEGLISIEPQMVQVLEFDPGKLKGN